MCEVCQAGCVEGYREDYGGEMKLVKPEPLTIKKKKQINEIVKNSYDWANKRLPFRVKYKPLYKV